MSGRGRVGIKWQSVEEIIAIIYSKLIFSKFCRYYWKLWFSDQMKMISFNYTNSWHCKLSLPVNTGAAQEQLSDRDASIKLCEPWTQHPKSCVNQGPSILAYVNTITLASALSTPIILPGSMSWLEWLASFAILDSDSHWNFIGCLGACRYCPRSLVS